MANLQEALKEYLVLKTVRRNEPVTVQEIEEELEMGMRDLVGPLTSLLDKGEVFEPQRDEFRAVPSE